MNRFPPAWVDETGAMIVRQGTGVTWDEGAGNSRAAISRQGWQIAPENFIRRRGEARVPAQISRPRNQPSWHSFAFASRRTPIAGTLNCALSVNH